MEEHWINIDGEDIYVLMTDLKAERETVVCIHGIGESHVSFSEAFQDTKKGQPNAHPQ